MQATSNSSQQDSPIAQARRARRRGGRRGGGRSRRGGEGVFDALDDPPGDIECIRCAYPDRVLPAALEKCLVEVLKADLHFSVYLDLQRDNAAPFLEDQREAAHRCGRYHLYRAAYKVLNAGDDMKQRTKFCDCIERFIRREFPSTQCDLGPDSACDFLANCVSMGHYTGFLTKAQSRARRVCGVCGDEDGEGVRGGLWSSDF